MLQDYTNQQRVGYLAALLDDHLLCKRLSGLHDEHRDVYLDNAFSYAEEVGVDVGALRHTGMSSLQDPAQVAATL